MADSIGWLPEPADGNYPAALSFLQLLFSPTRAAEIVDKLTAADMAAFKAKDIFRASRLSLLGISNSHVEKDRRKIASGTKLSPILLVRGEDRLIIADGYHRLCAVYSVDEDAMIPCKIV